jgi:hypothetical protein
MNNKILDKIDFKHITGQIYVITNIINNKKYIGQTRSHRLNKNKYRPFGYLGRFKDHINECNTHKKNSCKYLNNALIKYGQNNFKCELIIICDINELDNYEKYYIKQYDTLYPNGYNLTNGGQTFCYINIESVPIKVNKKSLKKTEETKTLISSRLKEYTNNDDVKCMLSENAIKQHYLNKLELFKNVFIDDLLNLEKYIYIISNNTNNTKFVRVKINNIKTNFVGKYEDIDTLKIRALNFIKELINRQCDQIAGNP